MVLSDTLFSSGFLWVINILVAVIVLAAFVNAPWKALIDKAERQHALFAASVSLLVMMQLKINWIDGLISLHFLMMTSVVVVFGWSFSLVIGFGVHLLLAIWDQNFVSTLGVDYLLSVIVPGSAAYVIFRIIILHRSKNLFVFLLGGGFFGAIGTLLISLAALFLLLLVNQQWDMLKTLYDKSLMVVLLSYSEGFLNGLIVTALTVFFPGIVRTFDEHKYLDS